MNLEEIRGLATEDLRKNEMDSREQLFRLRFASLLEDVNNTKQIRELRKQIARVKTVIREREQAGAKGQE